MAAKKRKKKYYAFHPESDCLMVIDSKKELNEVLSDGTCSELTKSEYLEIKAKLEAVESSKEIDETMEHNEFNLEWVDIDSIHPWKENPKTKEKLTKAAKKLSKIIKAHGIKSPIVCKSDTRVIYKGNTTHLACKMLKMKRVPVIFHEFPSEVAATAYGIADNKSSEDVQMDKDMLEKLMTTKEFKKLDLPTGYTEQQINLMNYDETQDVSKSQIKREKSAGLLFRATLECDKDEFQDLLKALKKLTKKFNTVRIA